MDEAQGEEEDTSDTTMATSVTFHSCKPQFFGPLPKEALKTAGRAAALAKVAISMWPGLLKFGRIAFTLLPALGDRYYRYTHVLAYIHTVVQTSIHAFLCVCVLAEGIGPSFVMTKRPLPRKLLEVKRFTAEVQGLC